VFKPTPGIIGTVLTSASPSATVLRVDAAYATYLAAQLAAGDWTYCQTQSGNAVEVMKITSISGNAITVARAVDASASLALAGGVNQLQFVMAASAVQDLITKQAMAPAITIAGAGGVTVTQPTTNHFIVTMPSTTLTSSDASITLTSASQNAFNLSINAGTAGCCK
jgi:hypothetical protein